MVVKIDVFCNEDFVRYITNCLFDEINGCLKNNIFD